MRQKEVHGFETWKLGPGLTAKAKTVICWQMLGNVSSPANL